MFNCNNLNLLNFTYYFKLTLGICMIIIPFIFLEVTVIKVIRYKQKFSKINKPFIKKQAKTFFYVVVIFLLAYSLNSVIRTPDNKCSIYAQKEIINEYKNNLEVVNNSNLTNENKEKYMNKVLTTAYDNYSKGIKTTDLTNKIKEEINEENIKAIQLNNKTNFLNETDTNKQNSVYVQNGTFYYKGYVAGNYSTYSGTNCPSDPLKQGYNNPYGYNNYFYTRLTKFIEEAGKNGYKITMSSQGCRSYQTQINYYNTMVRGRAARPGWSLHGFGIASDLEFYNQDGSICPYGRTDYSCPSMGWAHQNASKFGLTFPLLNAFYKEDWHIEPINKKTY